MSYVKDAARDVVERSRAGDQVAMAIIAIVRDNARKGSKKAKKSVQLMQRYIDSHPVSSMGYEAGHTNHAAKALWENPTAETITLTLPLAGFWTGVCALVHGPDLTRERAIEIGSVLPETDQPAFNAACLDEKLDGSRRGWFIGHVVLIARRIQRIRNPNVPIATFCPIVAWELGES